MFLLQHNICLKITVSNEYECMAVLWASNVLCLFSIHRKQRNTRLDVIVGITCVVFI